MGTGIYISTQKIQQEKDAQHNRARKKSCQKFGNTRLKQQKISHTQNLKPRKPNKN